MMARGQGENADAARVIARRSPLMVAWFTRIFRHALRSDFGGMRLSRSSTVPVADTPHLVIYTNHPSWWDPVAFLLLNDRLFNGRMGFAPIDAAMLKSYGFFERIGVFGVDLDTRAGARRFREVARGVLADPGHILLLTAQGRFADVRERPISLKPGLSHVADWAPDAMFVPLALEHTFWDERKPEMLLRFGPGIPARDLADVSVAGRTEHLAGALESTMDVLAREAIARDAGLFDTLEGGASGVGGVYDLWRRLRARIRGDDFSPANGEHL
jgi:1-acyl-sn-glycerol-3-phosphate acyltransferase